jgi:hypothetical protein
MTDTNRQAAKALAQTHPGMVPIPEGKPVDLSRVYADPIARLTRLAFEGQGEPSRFCKRSGLSMPGGWTGATQTWVLVCKATQCGR